ncbi:hypothetical protein CONPUDRAFT_162258 [Coniophora puteana RWD-64-598 SS2]|uniref:LIM zinc-binding domain-containing protein n=1 Tax=Coniophora puteana (strain RWD-64-598) TaxID=741705 RepID=A0A5M3N1P7_CONPW|nr:uncharacterized protein CONPUDRAFT_162258 [Coniophora puteana RWD-64-598 SS2]EIW84944.1 hypothetical protein CONPUDRAFT_162258 [Coniophora puteana RWD-64-598 SS2]
MAQLLKPAESQPRLSQLLPTVKCTTCSQPVPFSELGGHVCKPVPPLPSQPSRSTQAPSLVSSKLQNLIPHKTVTPTQQQQQPLPATHRQQTSLADVDDLSNDDPFQRLPPTMNNVTLPTPRVNSPAAPSSVSFRQQQSSGRPNLPVSLSSNRRPPERVSTPVRAVDGPSVQTPKTPPSTALPNPFDSPTPPPVLGRPRGASLARRDLSPAPQPPMPLPPPLGRLRTPSNASSIRPTLESRPRAPSSAPRPSLDPQRRPSLEPPRPSFDNRRPSMDGPRPSLEPPHPSFDGRRPSVDGQRPSLEPPRPTFDGRRPSVDGQSRPSTDAPRPSLDRRASPAPSGQVIQPPPRHSSGMRLAQGGPSLVNAPQIPPAKAEQGRMGTDIDTKSGGEAGMAGVGRRGFAAAARAGLFTLPMNQGTGVMGPYGAHMHQPAQQSLRPNAPGYLDIDATMKNGMRSATTPPLSPNSLHSRSPVSPHPVSPVSPSGSTTPTGGAFPSVSLASGKSHQHSASPDEVSDHVRIASPSRTPSPVSNPFNSRFSYESEVSASDGVHVPFLDAYMDKKRPEDDGSDDESVYTTLTSEEHGRSKNANRHSTATESEVGLAYADDDEDDTPVVTPLNVRKSSNASTVKFPTMSSSDNVRRPVRQDSAGSMFSSSSSGEGTSHSRGTSTTNTIRGGALERAMETLLEEGASVSLTSSGSVLASMSKGKAKAQRSNTVPGPAPEHKTPKPPTRSHTSPAHAHSERVGANGEASRALERVKKQRPCARCDSKIENGRWIEMDGGRVLCEQCWKNLYLPKCRRCNLPIEKQAVSSSDGQLKGKYHRNCFNCHACHKPFPDKEFYVFDGKPLCAYHYHEANDSLCSAVSCGQPIEGPCAVTHSGRRYHPQHLLCEYEGGCSERLAEYWEIDGQMFCDRHGSATAAARLGPQLRGGALEAARDDMRAMKRMTRFIDLGATPDEDEDDELDIL